MPHPYPINTLIYVLDIGTVGVVQAFIREGNYWKYKIDFRDGLKLWYYDESIRPATFWERLIYG